MLRRAALGIIVLVLALELSVVGAGRLLSRPVQVSVGAPPTDLQATAVTFPSSDGTTVHGWWCPMSSRRGTIVLLPGIRANRLSMLGRARFLRRAGYAVLLIDLRATGETLGRRITFGWDERHDVIAAVRFVHERAPHEPVGVIGSSLGGAASLFGASQLRVDAAVLEAVYPEITRATRNRLTKYIGPAQLVLTPLLLAHMKPVAGLSPSKLKPLAHVRELNCPLLLVGGDDDPNTTADETKLLFETAQPPKELWLIPKAGHVDFHRFAGAEYESKIIDFFERCFSAAR
jgi:fermentation-respiration switch protein FrsA (DUF1100 family)